MFVPSFFVSRQTSRSASSDLTLSYMRSVLLTLCIVLLTVGASAQWAVPSDDVPAYHAQPPAGGETLPPVLTAQQLQQAGLSQPWQAKVYAVAAHVPRVLYQLPCNCRCDRALGHKSLLSCFSGLHGGECSTCAQEGVYAYRMTKQGKTPEQIRAGIAAHEYQTISVNAAM